MSEFDYDLFTIGAGSGGVRASRVAAAHGARVAVAEEYRVGGTCVIRGCVPKKMLVYGAQFADDLESAAQFGWTIPQRTFDWPTLRDNVLNDVNRLNGLFTQTLEGHGVEIFHERATISGPNEIRLASGKTVTARKILIATGARPHVPEFAGSEHGITSNEAFHLDQLPRRILIAGAGYIANEFAGVFLQLGCEVTIVNRSDQLLRSYDASLRARLLKASEDKGIRFLFNTHFKKIEKLESGAFRVEFDGSDPVEVDCVLYATGRVPNIEGLGLENAGIEPDENNAIRVDEYTQTSCESIHAVGDVTNRVQLTPVAIREGQAFADTVFGGKPTTVNYDCIPSAVFSHPPLAAVGLTEEEARATGAAIKVYESDFRPMKNVLAGRTERSLYKMVCDEASGRILGIHIIAPEAAEIVQVAAIAVKAGLTKADFDATMAIHPTMSEELVLMR